MRVHVHRALPGLHATHRLGYTIKPYSFYAIRFYSTFFLKGFLARCLAVERELFLIPITLFMFLLTLAIAFVLAINVTGSIPIRIRTKVLMVFNVVATAKRIEDGFGHLLILLTIFIMGVMTTLTGHAQLRSGIV